MDVHNTNVKHAITSWEHTVQSAIEVILTINDLAATVVNQHEYFKAESVKFVRSSVVLDVLRRWTVV